ncbi:MAG TPA: CHAD domain-containing protein [Burkholderiales bacterium]|nr:CHAD domain-containing protein [Burkholderiales bacterium]
MGKHMKPAHPAAVKAALSRQLAEAALGLSGGGIDDVAIHAARKKLKSARAKLRLLRDAAGRAAYTRENAAVRDAARPLSELRDAKVMLDTVNDLLARKRGRARRLLLTALRGRLRAQHREARRRFEAEKRAAKSAGALERTVRRTALWDVPNHGATLERSIRRMYRKARKAFAAADAERSPASLHELRKLVKYLREALAPVDGTPLPRAAGIVERADKLASELGEDHDLCVLEQHLSTTEASLHAHSASFAGEIAERRGKLQRRALERAAKLLRKKPRAFVKRLALT